MIGVALFLLLAASSRVELTDGDYQIPAGKWKCFEIDLRQQPATVIANYHVRDGGEQVRIALNTLSACQDSASLQEDDLITATPRGGSGAFSYRVRARDNYAVLVDNRAGKGDGATVRLRVALDFARPRVTQLSPERQFTVVAVSVAAFFAMVTWSARKLLKAARG